MGNDDEFERMYAEHYRSVLAYALRRASPDVAEDLAAETFLVAWRRFERVPADSLPWLLAVARRLLANQFRGARRRGALLDRLRAASESLPPPEASSRVLLVLSKLGERDREVLMLVAWEGLDGRRAAEVLGCSQVAFLLRLHRAKQQLRAELARLESRVEITRESA